MALDTTTPRSRRALLAGGLGGLAALAMQAVGRPAPARAAHTDVALGGSNTTDATTTIRNTDANESAIWGDSTPTTGTGVGVRGDSAAHSGRGVWGRATGNVAYGVYGEGAGGTTLRADATGVRGTSGSSSGVEGDSGSGHGVVGTSDTGLGVYASSDSNTGLYGRTLATGRPAVLGESLRDGTGMMGSSTGGGIATPPPRAKTGVFGTADQDGTAVGVYGASTAGRGGLFQGAKAQIRLAPSSATSHPARGARGDLFVDKSGRLWFCKGQTTWVRLA